MNRLIEMGLKNNLKFARWLPVTNIERPFVKHKDSNDSAAKIWRPEPIESHITLSVIIPTFDAHRDGYFLKLLAQIDRQDFSHNQILVVKGDPRQGRAINFAAALAKGKYILTLDDDTSLPDPMTFSKLVTVMESHPDIGIAGGNNVVPADAKSFVKRVMKQLPRRSWEPVQEIIDSDLAEHPCMIMRAKEFRLIGGENELIPRGLDPYLRNEFRKIGKKVVVVPGIIYHHQPPDTLNKLLKQFYRNGRNAAYTNRHFSHWMIETPNRHGQFKIRKSFLTRLLRFPMHLLQAVVTGKPIWFICEILYAFGFACEYFLPGKCHKFAK